MDDKFWSTNNTQNATLQNAFLLHITTEYNSTMYDTLACRTSSLGSEAYI